ncbi:HAMP domain-containing sensor histidine kinase [Nocardioides aquiterrae]|uniref:histidine kinase n=1 Tax=Nocardioides aquiterrae TaxID=203799 RepID=A0ABP4FC85_9ACTN
MAAVMVGVGIGIQMLLSYTAQRDIDRVLAERADAVIAVADARSTPGGTGLDVPADAIEPGVRVYDDHGHPVAGSIEQEARDAADDLATAPAPTTVEVGERIRLLAEPFTTAHGQRGVVVVSQDTSPYERAEADALAATIAIGLLVVGLAAVIARRVTTQALAPVTQMAERAAEWSEHDLAHRFDLGPAHDELGQLGETLDRLLDRVAMAIRSEQRLTSELAHELRTPLTAVQGSADLALLRGGADDATRADLVEISRAARAMAEVITTLVDVARDPSAAAASATCRARDVVDALRQSVPAGLDLVEDIGGSSARIAGPRTLVLRAVAPVLDNAIAHAGSTIRIRATDLPHAVEISIDDDGPGIDARMRERVFDVGASGSGGTGLGLGIAQRVARSLGGEIVVGTPAAGASFAVRLPRA